MGPIFMMTRVDRRAWGGCGTTRRVSRGRPEPRPDYGGPGFYVVRMVRLGLEVEVFTVVALDHPEAAHHSVLDV
ncbi:hypothetical protein, partial [Streptomyces sp. NPDC047453]|uniref:hypothetical protein n=1 Tax=Streptomyces sp. NPDC047453 TaxID=3154812 RepID=UPI0033F09209